MALTKEQREKLLKELEDQHKEFEVKIEAALNDCNLSEPAKSNLQWMAHIANSFELALVNLNKKQAEKMRLDFLKMQREVRSKLPASDAKSTDYQAIDDVIYVKYVQSLNKAIYEPESLLHKIWRRLKVVT